MKRLHFLMSLLLLSALSQASHSADTRWYTWDDVVKGGNVFANQCASCHGAKAEGKTPAPALNGTAHAWHHSFSQLKQTIKKGTQRLGGSMPPFEDKLNDQEINQALAWVQSHWSDEVYSLWLKNTGGRK